MSMRTVQELSDLNGRRALVVGGAGHVGGAAVEALKELGADVVIADLEGEQLHARANALGAVALPADIKREEECRSCIGLAVEALGGLDILVHAAALVGSSQLEGWAVELDQQSVAAWNEALAVNLTSAFVLTQEARSHLGKGGNGSIILVSSIYGVAAPDFSLYEGTGMHNPAAYGASKAGLLQLMRYLATALAPIRVNAISPGGIERGQDATFVSRYAERTPLGRMATEEDLKGAVAFLASDLSAYVTGHNLLVDGGWTAW
jgi:NAD(P)-dependent dehydrogenase (short-subunit alcohol dehydrogenase family)